MRCFFGIRRHAAGAHPGRALGLVAALLLAVWYSPAAWAQQQTGTIKGRAEDTQGAPVSGVKITVFGKSLIGGVQERTTGADGEFRFLQLPPGRYTLHAEAAGLRSQHEEGIALGLGTTVTRILRLEPRTAEEVITVIGKVPVVDVEKVTVGQSVSGDLLEGIASGRTYQDAVQILPGVTGGGNPTIHGGSSYSNQYLVDGVNTTDPTTNTFSLNFNFDAIEELEVITGTFSPEYGNVTGGVVNVVTKSGSNEFTLDSSLYFASDRLMMEGIDEQPRDFTTILFNVNAGGPIIVDKLWYFLSLEYDDSTSQLPRESPIPDLDGQAHAKRHFQSLYWLGKLTYALDAHNRFTFLGQGDPTRIDNTSQDATMENAAETHQDQGGLLTSLRWDGLYDPWAFKVQGAYKTQFLDIFPQERVDSGSLFAFPGVIGFGHLSDKNDFGVAPGCLGQDQLAPGQTVDPTCSQDVQSAASFGQGYHYDLDTGASRVGSGTDYYIQRTRWQLTATASYFLDGTPLGDHELKIGTDLAWLRDEETSRYPGGASYFLDADLDGDGVADPYAAWISSSDDNDFSSANDGRIFAGFLLDNWKLWERLLLQPGLRVEKAVYENYKGEAVLDFFVLSPRFGFSLDLTGDGRTRLHGGYGQLYETGNLQLSKFVGKSIGTRLAWYDPETGRYVEDPGYVRLQGGEAGTTIDQDALEPMRTDEYQIGIERALTKTFGVDLTYIHRYTRHAWEDDETNLIWNQAGTDVIGSYDGTGQQTFRLTSLDDAYRRYDAIELAGVKQLADNWSLNANYTLSWYRGTTEEMLTRAFDNPRQNIYLDGYLPDDHRQTIKAQALYRFDFGLSLGASYLYETGGPFSKYFLNDYDGDWTNRQAPRGLDPHDDLTSSADDRQLRLPDYTRLDLRVAFNFQKTTGLNLDLLADITNVLNASTCTAIENRVTDSGTFGQCINRQQPFQTQLGLRFRY